MIEQFLVAFVDRLHGDDCLVFFAEVSLRQESIYGRPRAVVGSAGYDDFRQMLGPSGGRMNARLRQRFIVHVSTSLR